MDEQVGYKVGDSIYVPSSALGKEYGVGKILAIWHNKMTVTFGGHIGIYTISQHTIIPEGKTSHVE